MPISGSKARSLCTESEYNLFKWSSAKMVKTLSPSQLSQKIDRARKLRNKYRDLAKQQRGEARGKRKPTGTRAAKGNERTVEKAQLFAEVLERFEGALKAADAKSSKSAKSPAKKSAKKNTTAKKPTEKKPSTKKKTTKKKSTTEKALGPKKKPARMPGAQAKKQSAKSPAVGPLVPLAAGGSSVVKPSLGSAAGHESPFGSLVGSQGKSDLDARQTRRVMSSKAAKAGRIESRFARTVQEKIQGHISGQTKRNQARRDTKS
jgi:hypothetical protein